MKFSSSISKGILYTCTGAIVLSLIAWSPPTGDRVVIIGNSNTTEGFINNLPGTNEPANISAFRGYIGGSNNIFGAVDSYALILGGNNAGNASRAVIAGSDNKIALTGSGTGSCAKFIGVFGSSNVVKNGSNGVLTAGSSNGIHSVGALVSGFDNNIASPISSVPTYYSSAIGSQNQVIATSGWTIGDSNVVRSDKGIAIGNLCIAGKSGTASSQILRAVAIGTGVRAEITNSTVLGRYNLLPMQADDVLAIGTGANEASRFTALRVTADGGVILGRAQGDISMGAYGN